MVDVCNDGIQPIQVIVEARTAVVTAFIFIVEAELHLVSLSERVGGADIGRPLFLVQFPEVAHCLLSVEFK